MSPIPALQMLSVLQVLIQATQHKDDTHVSPSCAIQGACHYLFLWMFSIPAHQVLTVLQVPIQATQHKDDTLP